MPSERIWLCVDVRETGEVLEVLSHRLPDDRTFCFFSNRHLDHLDTCGEYLLVPADVYDPHADLISLRDEIEEGLDDMSEITNRLSSIIAQLPVLEEVE